MSRLLHVSLPEEMEPYREDLEYFFQSMIRKLHVNRHKGTTKDLDPIRMLAALRVEADEVQAAIEREGQFDAPLEAADVANFGFLIARAIWHMTRDEWEELRKRAKNGSHV